MSWQHDDNVRYSTTMAARLRSSVRGQSVYRHESRDSVRVGTFVAGSVRCAERMGYTPYNKIQIKARNQHIMCGSAFKHKIGHVHMVLIYTVYIYIGYLYCMKK